MIDAIIRGSLGEFGSALLDLYLENAFWINGIVFIYAVILLIAKQGYRKIASAIKLAMMEKYGEDIEKKDANWYKKVLEKNDLDWENIASQTWIPVISTKGALGFRIKSVEHLKEDFTPEIIHQTITDNVAR
jgi:hypothetical protein